MQSSLKKSLYLGLAALSFGAVATVSTTASAKSYATAGAYSTLKSDATTRNVEATGTNALYTKPGTVKGAKVVASKATMATLASSKKSANYFRAYGVKTTNRGSVYYRVVTMDGKYRGYVYGGKSDTAFAGGIKSANTTTENTTDTNIGKTVYFANPGKTNVTWTAPKYTQYKASKNVANTTPFAGDSLKVTKAATKTREGSLYYYVEDATHPSVSGWIYSKAVTSNAKVSFNHATDVKINFANDGKVVASGVLQGLKADSNKEPATAVGTAVGTDTTEKATTAAEGTATWVDAQLKGTGYAYDKSSNANKAALLSAKTGDTITLSVTKGTNVTNTIKAYVTNVGTDGTTVTNTKLTSMDETKSNEYLTAIKAATTTTNGATTTDNSKITAEKYAKQVVFPTLTAGFSGSQGASYSSSDLTAFANNNKLGTLYSPTFYVKTSGDASNAAAAANTVGIAAYVKYTLTSANKGIFGSNDAQLFYTAETIYGSKSPVNITVNTGNSIFG
ncbi:hypothetical protein [Levilactobacillus zymae]|uniref:hypothetical protein n=1 Tax=Levilactobacillus zymae TaxID=267363 RepID=UPI0028BB6EAC|nr:hypothetical protein [Levilactobacillus zymae]MDT6981387.1 hypothetical protein [Levilactobacillus zymae]